MIRVDVDTVLINGRELVHFPIRGLDPVEAVRP